MMEIFRKVRNYKVFHLNDCTAVRQTHRLRSSEPERETGGLWEKSGLVVSALSAVLWHTRATKQRTGS